MSSYQISGAPKDADLISALSQMNQHLRDIGRRLDELQRTKFVKPATVRNVTVDGKQGCFNIVWEKISGVSGYIVEGAADTAMTQTINNDRCWGENDTTHEIPVGNVAVTRSFRVWGFLGDAMGNIVVRGDPSSVKTATTAAYAGGEGAPSTPPVRPTRPEHELLGGTR